MANEATIRVSLQINKDNLIYQSNPQGYATDVTGTKGPTPGAILVALAGTDVDLSQLTVPGLCHLRNLDITNYVEYGIREPDNSRFYPLGEIGPGESYILKLSRNLRQEYQGTGTGTSAPTNFLHIKANTLPCVVLVEAFEK